MDKKTRPMYMLSTRDPLQTYGHIHTKSEGMEKDIACKWKLKKSGVAMLISNKVDIKDHYKTQGRIQHNGQGIYPRRYNNCKYLCTQYRASQCISQRLTAIKGKIDSNTVIVEDFNTPLTLMDKTSRQKINKETQDK